MRQLGNLAISENQFDQATQYLDDAVKFTPQDNTLQVDAAVAWFRKGDPKKAEAKGPDKITVPVAPEVAPVQAPEPVQIAQVNAPVIPTHSGVIDSLGAIQALGALPVPSGLVSGSGARAADQILRP